MKGKEKKGKEKREKGKRKGRKRWKKEKNSKIGPLTAYFSSKEQNYNKFFPFEGNLEKKCPENASRRVKY